MNISNSHALLTQGPQPGLDRIQQAAKDRKAQMDQEPAQTKISQAKDKVEATKDKVQVHAQEFDGELAKLMEANQAKSQAFIKEAQGLLKAQGGGTLSQVLGGDAADLTEAVDTIKGVQDTLGARQQQLLDNPQGLNGGDLLGMLNQARSALI
ncbi:hypothetical protein [Ferrimonas sp. YFM]|uniref:hypothetical protein n=1 Tax=Ferrimonas sp. YFM TaxID=3028878 RepID=UPI0025743A79|nr:hypothetical protein [Ferrimonas sp. YFM]BDY04728.1 hypothetical protein F0521_17690 [Ferrimonas sp. YFM]